MWLCTGGFDLTRTGFPSEVISELVFEVQGLRRLPGKGENSADLWAREPRALERGPRAQGAGKGAHRSGERLLSVCKALGKEQRTVAWLKSGQLLGGLWYTWTGSSRSLSGMLTAGVATTEWLGREKLACNHILQR